MIVIITVAPRSRYTYYKIDQINEEYQMVTKVNIEKLAFEDNINLSAEVVAKLCERSKEIGQIVDTI